MDETRTDLRLTFAAFVRNSNNLSQFLFALPYTTEEHVFFQIFIMVEKLLKIWPKQTCRTEICLFSFTIKVRLLNIWVILALLCADDWPLHFIWLAIWKPFCGLMYVKFTYVDSWLLQSYCTFPGGESQNFMTAFYYEKQLTV